MKSQYYRTFIGLPLQVESDFLQASSALMTELKGERISWVKPENFHVTLRFIGDTSLSDIEIIGSALHQGVKIPGRTRLQLNGLAGFGPRKSPRVIWTGFEQSNFFDLLKDDVDRALEDCGIPAPEQPFRAHLTLGRIRSLQRLARFYSILEDRTPEFRSTITFEKMVFFRSILGPGGPEYRVLDEFLFSQDISPS